MQAMWRTHGRIFFESGYESGHESVEFYFSDCLLENGDGLGLDALILLIERYYLFCRLWLSVAQPVEECHKHVQDPMLQVLH